MLPLLAWFGRIGLVARFRGLMPFSYASPNAIPTEHTLPAFLLSVILGGSRFTHFDWLRFDQALHAIMGLARFPAKDATRRFFHRFGPGEIQTFWRPLWAWLLTLWTPPPKGFTLNLNSTIYQRSGQQEGAAKGYNPDVQDASATIHCSPCWPRLPWSFTSGCAVATPPPPRHERKS